MTIGVNGKTNALALVTQSALGGLDLGRFECLRDCARCCDYKVSVVGRDIATLEAAGLARADFLDAQRQPATGFAGCMRRRGSSCVLLDEGRRCRQYEHRPLYCRLYPYVREAYVSIQLDVDLSCPGVGNGEAVSDDALAAILVADDAATHHETILQSRHSEIETAERLLAYRGRQAPFEEIVETIHAAEATGLGALRDVLSGAAEKIPVGLASDESRRRRHGALSEDGAALLAEYLVLWSRRQTLWRWGDAYAAVTPAVTSRTEGIMSFLQEVGEIVEACAARLANGGALNAQHVLGAIRECDSYCRTYCHSFRLGN